MQAAEPTNQYLGKLTNKVNENVSFSLRFQTKYDGPMLRKRITKNSNKFI